MFAWGQAKSRLGVFGESNNIYYIILLLNDFLICVKEAMIYWIVWFARFFKGTSKVPAIKGQTRTQRRQSISSNSLCALQEDQSRNSNSWQTKLTTNSNQASNMNPQKTEIHIVNPQAHKSWNQNQLHPTSNLQQTQSTNNHPSVQPSSNNRKGRRFARDKERFLQSWWNLKR